MKLTHPDTKAKVETDNPEGYLSQGWVEDQKAPTAAEKRAAAKAQKEADDQAAAEAQEAAADSGDAGDTP